MQSIHVRLDDDLHAEVKAEAARRKLSIQKFAKAALLVQLVTSSPSRWLDKRERKRTKQEGPCK